MRRALPTLVITLGLSFLAKTALCETLLDVGMDPEPPLGSIGLAGVLGLSGDPQTMSGSAADCLTGLTGSLITVLDANPDLPGLYYAEDAFNGWIAVSAVALEFRFEELGSDGLPYASNVYLDGTALASIVYPPAYVNHPFAVIYQSRVYCGTITEEDIYMTAIPEPSAGGLLFAGVACLAVCLVRRSKRSITG